MSFSNRVRLPIRVIRPQYPQDKTEFRDANGVTKTLSVTLKKTYEMDTDYLPEVLHERIIVALSHDNVSWEGEKYFGGVSLNGNYDIAWSQDFPNDPLAPGKCLLDVTPFDANNNNCVTCDELSQISLVNDAYPYALNEGTTNVLDVINNDSICCYPVVFSITSFDSDYLSAASIDSSGNLSVTLKTGLISANGIKLVTYRATCDNGGFDEADVSGNINGSIVGCLAPLGLVIDEIGTTSMRATWTPPSPLPDHYYYQLLDFSTHAIVQSSVVPVGTTSVILTGLTPNIEFIFQVRSQCAGPGTDHSDATASNYIAQTFSTNPVSVNSCGQYRFFPEFSAGIPPGTKGSVFYLGCDGVYHSVQTFILTPIVFCALQSSPGAYVDIHSSDFPGARIIYQGLCS